MYISWGSWFEKRITGITGAWRRNNREGWQELQNRITGVKISIMGSTLPIRHLRSSSQVWDHICKMNGRGGQAAHDHVYQIARLGQRANEGRRDMESGRPDTETPKRAQEGCLMPSPIGQWPHGKVRQGFSHQNIKGKCSLLDVGRRAGSQSEVELRWAKKGQLHLRVLKVTQLLHRWPNPLYPLPDSRLQKWGRADW